MRPYIFFLLLIIILLSTSANAGVQRSIQFSDVYYNGNFLYKSIEVTLTPDNYDNFNMPGYYIVEYIPADLQFKSTNADWHSLSDNKLSLMRVLPPADNFSIKYTLKIPLNSPNTTYSFIGTYKDENKNTGEINSSDIKYTPSSSGSSSTTPTPAKTYLTPTPAPTPTFKTPVSIDTPPEEIKIKPISANISTLSNEGTPLPLILFFIPLLVLLIGIRYKFHESKIIKIPVKILPGKSIFINYQLMSFPVKLEVKNTTDGMIFPKIKIKGNLPIIIDPKFLVVSPQSISYFNIISGAIEDNKTYSGDIYITKNGKK